MTLAEISTFVTNKMQDTTDEAVSICKSFVKRNYENIYNSALWKETICSVSQSVAAQDTSITISSDPDFFYYPTSSTVAANAPRLDLVIAVRFTTTGDTEGFELLHEDWQAFFQWNPSLFENDASHRATPRNFTHLPKNSAGHCRVKLVPVPTAAGTLFTLGKLKLTNLTNDTDEPTIRGITNALIALTEADMLEYGRRPDEAVSKRREGVELMSMAHDMEKGQQENSSRIIPLIDSRWSRDDL